MGIDQVKILFVVSREKVRKSEMYFQIVMKKSQRFSRDELHRIDDIIGVPRRRLDASGHSLSPHVKHAAKNVQHDEYTYEEIKSTL